VKFKEEEWNILKNIIVRELDYDFDKEYELLGKSQVSSDYFKNVVEYYFLSSDISQEITFDEYLKDKKIYLDYVKRNAYE
tara:strand:+ start:1953 stop:2192 length:240 start_codon:yes stop_codon:yes gene_type:complete